MRVETILAGIIALASTVAAAPGYSGGLGYCFDDHDCVKSGGTCVKTAGSFVGKCAGGNVWANWVPTPTTPSPSIALGSGAPRFPSDIAAAASRVATRTDLPAAITEFAKKVASNPQYVSAGLGSMTPVAWVPWVAHPTPSLPAPYVQNGPGAPSNGHTPNGANVPNNVNTPTNANQPAGANWPNAVNAPNNVNQPSDSNWPNAANAPNGAGAPGYTYDITAAASKIAANTDLPASVTEFAKSIMNNPQYTSEGPGAMTPPAWTAWNAQPTPDVMGLPGAPSHATDLAEAASRIATRTNLPAAITDYAKSIINNPSYATGGLGSMTPALGPFELGSMTPTTLATLTTPAPARPWAQW